MGLLGRSDYSFIYDRDYINLIYKLKMEAPPLKEVIKKTYTVFNEAILHMDISVEILYPSQFFENRSP